MKVMLCKTPNHKHVVVQDDSATPVTVVLAEDSLKNIIILLSDYGHKTTSGAVKKELFTKGKYVIDKFDNSDGALLVEMINNSMEIIEGTSVIISVNRPKL